MIPFAFSGLTARLIIGAAFAVSFMLLGMGTHKVFTDRKIARMERDWATERAAAATVAATAQAEARRIETAWRDHVSQREKEYAANMAAQTARVRALDAAGVGLRQQLAAYTAAGSGAESATDAVRRLQHRVETLGLLLDERDAMAGESERDADELTGVVALCRAYGDEVGARP